VANLAFPNELARVARVASLVSSASRSTFVEGVAEKRGGVADLE
jgi:hypothetical protein